MEWGPAPVIDDLVTIRLDLHDSLGHFDVDSVMIELREELGELRNSWPAFDYGFAMYWAVHHRKELMPTGSRRHGRLRAASDVATSEIIGALGIPGASLGSKIVLRALDGVRHGRLRRLAVSAAPRVADLVSALVRDDSVVLRTGFAGLLSAELDLMAPGHRPCLVVFVDATERLSDSGLALLNSVVWQLPQVLWVLTGRNRIRWAEETHRDVPFYGATVWPGLVAESGAESAAEPQQHLVGNLSDDDAAAFLRAATSARGLGLTEAQIASVVRESDGLPLWMDIVVQIAQQAILERRAVRDAELVGPFDDLVRRLLRDLERDEQRIVRAACLVSRFDVELVAAGAGVDAGAAARLVERSMIIRDGAERRLPFRLHDEIRRVVRTAGAGIPGGWTETDWRSAGSRVVDELRRRHDSEVDASAMLDLLDQVLEVGLNSDVPIGWLRKAVADLPSMHAIAERHPAAFGTPRNWAEWFCTLLSSWRPGVTTTERRDRLRNFAARSSPVDLRMMAQRFLGYSLRANDQYEETIALFEALVAEEPTQLHRFQLANSLVQASRFSEALALLETWPDLDPTSAAAVRGSIAFAHGRLAENVELKNGRIAKYETTRQYRVLSEVSAHTTLCRALLGIGQEPTAVQGADQAEDDRHPDAVCTYLSGAAISCAGDADTVRRHVKRARDVAELFGRARDNYKTIVPLVFDAVVRRDPAAVAHAHALVAARPQRRARIWRAVGFWLEAEGVEVEEPEVAWLEDVDVVRGRWNALVDKRRAALGLS